MMSPRLRSVVSRLGFPGIASLLGVLLAAILSLAGFDLLTFLVALATFPFLIWLSLRIFFAIQRKTLWSLRNRLLFVYGLFGALPLLLILTLVAIGSYFFMNELAVYLASSELERRLQGVDEAVDAIRRQPVESRATAGPEIAKAFRRFLPGVVIQVRDSSGEHRFPADAAPFTVPAKWKDARGLVVVNGHFYGWCHAVHPDSEITAMVPLTERFIQNLVPHLGQISLIEGHDPPVKSLRTKPAASLQSKKEDDPDPKLRAVPLPPALSRLDIPVTIVSTQPHDHLESPNESFNGLLLVRSRPSAVLGSFFSGTETVREVLFDLLIAISILFLIVELIAVWIGVSLSRRITGAVNQLYEGTRRVIRGDFRHRIPVRDHDQLADLAQSFNQMTGNLERLLVIEKEKERLQTEVEIAREVQGQLYPKAAPPVCGLKLTVRCDPARMVSGDYYDYVQTSHDKMVFAIGDVAGKGISAALLMATLQAALRAQVSAYAPIRETTCADDPQIDCSKLVSKLNRQIYAHTAPEKYATFFFAVFDEASSSLTYTNAGHLSPLLFRGDQVISLDSNGTVVGAFPFAKYDESCLNMDHNDLLVCYTDGITEPENAYGEMFGEERLISLVQKHRHADDNQIVDLILDAVRSWTGSPELHDDMTLLLARQVGSRA